MLRDYVLFRIGILIFLFNSSVDAGRRVRPRHKTTNFDYFLLAQSWLPQLCHMEGFPIGCAAEERYENNSLVIHGMWPGLHRPWPHLARCHSDAFDPTRALDGVKRQKLRRAWPNIGETRMSPDYADFWGYQWMKHGTCTELSQQQYMRATLQLHRQVIRRWPKRLETSVARSTLLTALEAGVKGSVALGCDDTLSLLYVYTCWERRRNERQLPGRRRPCPVHVHRPPACGATIRLRSFDVDAGDGAATATATNSARMYDD